MVISRNPCGLLVALLLPLCFSSLASADSGQSSWTARNDTAAINIQTASPSYKFGQPVMLRVGIKNVSPQTCAFFNGAPWRKAILVVKDAAGQAVAPIDPRDVTDYKSSQGHAGRIVQPGATAWLSWNDSEWSDISHWGYTLNAGTYTISAIPTVSGQLPPATDQPGHAGGAPAQGKFVTDLKTVNSNTITIQIMP